MRPTLPGLPTVSALMLACLLAAWLGVSGPIHFSDLKDWQPLLAACIALGAGTLAYQAAMAKVRFDREIHQQEVERRNTGIYMRLRFPMQILQSSAERLEQMVEYSWRANDITITKADIHLRAPPELDEAWSALEAFPIQIARELAQIRSSLRDLHMFVGSIPDDTTWIINAGYQVKRSAQMVQTENVAKVVGKAAFRVEQWLAQVLRDAE